MTIHDVAGAAGVSVSTVSLALNHPGRVSEQTRDKVLRIVDDLGFVPKAEAVARARRAVGRIGVLGPFTSFASAGRRLNGVLRGISGEDLEIVVFDHDSASESNDPFLAGLPRSGRLDGLLVASLLPDDALIEQLIERGLPTVLIDARHPRLSSVHTDDVVGGRMVGEHLLKVSGRVLGFLGELQRSERHVSPAVRRLEGYRAALHDAGVTLSPSSVMWTPRSFPEAVEAAGSLLEVQSGSGAAQAVFASDDLLAAAVVQAAGRAGLRVPGDVAVVGFDDTEVATAMDLTTIRQPLEQSGELAVQLISEQILRPGPVRSTFLELTLIRRGSA